MYSHVDMKASLKDVIVIAEYVTGRVNSERRQWDLLLDSQSGCLSVLHTVGFQFEEFRESIANPSESRKRIGTYVTRCEKNIPVNIRKILKFIQPLVENLYNSILISFSKQIFTILRIANFEITKIPYVK